MTCTNRMLQWRVGACAMSVPLTEHDLPMPTITSPNDVIVTVLYVGICGTDLQILAGLFPGAPEDLVLGHEVTGRVHAVGADVTSVQVGSAVVVKPVPSCGGHCSPCRRGAVARCTTGGGVAHEYGIFADGGWRRFWKLNARQVEPLPVGLPEREGVLAEPVACVCRGLERCGPVPSDSTVLVLGAGIIGLLWAALLNIHGCSDVTVSEVNHRRRKLVHTLTPGAKVVGPDDLEGAHNQFDLVIDCTGNVKAIESALRLLRHGGKLNIFGCTGAEDVVSFKPIDFLLKDLTIVSTLIDSYSVPRALPLVLDMYREGFLDFAKLGIQVFSPREKHSGMADTALEAVEALKQGLVTKSVLMWNI